MTDTHLRPSQLLAQRIRIAKLPDRLFHYTTQSGCIGIFSTQAIWATNIRFLNDEKEFILAHDLAFEYLEELVATSTLDNNKTAFYFALKDQFHASWDETYVASFSTEGDLLSQWRAYAKNGFALGFHPGRLAALVHLNSVLAPCVYNYHLQRQLVEQAIDTAAEYYVAVTATEHRKSAIAIAVEECRVSLGLVAPLIKHRAFSEECEWRLIVNRIAANNGLVRFRPGRSMITPYIEVPLREGSDVLRLEEVIVGPTPHPATGKTAVAMMQMSTGVGVELFSSSDIPYRDW